MSSERQLKNVTGAYLGTKVRRVKSGCRTCKIRRIKCDEARPACSRCVSTGRKCDGYGVWTADPTKSRLPATLQGPSVARNVHERHSFDWFLSRTSKKIPGVFEPEFWKTLVLQASATEPAVFHAAVALGAAHKREMLLATGTVALVPDEQECFILRQYNAAISHLQHHLAAGVDDKDSAHVAAIACMLFICLEFLRGN
ncbi:Transcriptional regulatory moc3 [Fusarium albosuccineum]|uniref:Transcriptional regulatory moc3 n=1 Tax=Fusarium albosuccineum TaxID=1237068 RepID=A0A8H4L491_9HYPO|nr:Transcriptional regulatory moc3 [Fusarium albosuccineum]